MGIGCVLVVQVECELVQWSLGQFQVVGELNIVVYIVIIDYVVGYIGRLYVYQQEQVLVGLVDVYYRVDNEYFVVVGGFVVDFVIFLVFYVQVLIGLYCVGEKWCYYVFLQLW